MSFATLLYNGYVLCKSGSKAENTTNTTQVDRQHESQTQAEKNGYTEEGTFLIENYSIKIQAP